MPPNFMPSIDNPYPDNDAGQAIDEWRALSGDLQAARRKADAQDHYSAARAFGWPIYRKPDAPPRYVKLG